ncbi:MAG: transglycosylase SLT domain-containing protein [Xanthomonadales bacterium]|nr:transglycosylase SLT domain-containing protein [Xanthomonadales bacterium]
MLFPLLLFLALAAQAADLADQRVQFREAMELATRPGGDWKRLAAGLEEAGYPLAPYIEYTALRQHVAKVDAADVKRFLARWPDSLPASDLRDAYLRELARRGDWAGFRAFRVARPARDLQCHALEARLAGGETLDYTDFESLWNGSQALPAACDPVVRALRASGALSDLRVEERLGRSAEAGHASAAGAAAALLTGARRNAADRLVAALKDPAATLAKAKNWGDEAAAREAVSFALARLARRNSAAAETAWAGLQARFEWQPVQKNRILNAIALYRSTSYSDDAMARLKALPPAAEDDATREWRVRVALASGDSAATLEALDRLSGEQQRDERWRYLKARTLDKLGRAGEARPLFAVLAREANFHGFLAADWIGEPYSICPRTLGGDPAAQVRLERQPDLARAFEFHALGKLPEARREWNFAMDKLDAGERERAADLAWRRGWYDRAVFALSKDPDTLRLYEQRFPLGMEKEVRAAAAAAGVDPAFAYAIIRAESAWMSDARSGADAYGLMQLLPGVGKQVAREAGLPWSGASGLFEPSYNVRLGTRFLGQMADRYQGSPWLASAAYNAGGAPVGRWIGARGSLEPDFFIETIPYRETREYVARVLAFSVIYDWRLNGKVLPLSVRMPKVGQAYAASGKDAARKAVVCAVPPAGGAGDDTAAE